MTGGNRTVARFAAICALVLVAACSTQPDDLQTRQAANDAYFAQDFSCAPGPTKAMDYATFFQKREQYPDECVQVIGFATAFALYADANGMNDPGQTEHPHDVIRLYWKEPEVAHRLQQAPSFVEITARVRSCKKRYDFYQDKEQLRAKRAGRPPENGVLVAGAFLTCDIALFVSSAKFQPTAMD